MKSAYEAALEALERRGIEPPRSESLSAADRERVAEIRAKAAAKLAELEILHRDRRKRSAGGTDTEEAEREYLAERRRIEERRDRDIERLRSGE